MSQDLTGKLVKFLSPELFKSYKNVKQKDKAVNDIGKKATDRIGRLANRPDLTNNELSQKLKPLAFDKLYASAFSTRLNRICMPLFYNLMMTLAGEQSRVIATAAAAAPVPATSKRPSTSTTFTSQINGGVHKKRRYN